MYVCLHVDSYISLTTKYTNLIHLGHHKDVALPEINVRKRIGAVCCFTYSIQHVQLAQCTIDKIDKNFI